LSSEHDEKTGTVKISDEVIAICAVNAVQRTQGVSDLSPVFSDNFSKNILGKEPLYKGIKISQNEEGISIDIFVVVDYGVKIPAVAWDIQDNVKKEVEEMTDSQVKAVNIHVQGVRMKDEVGADHEQV